MPPKEVFLSHSSQDGEVTRRIGETLRNHAVPVWYSETNIVGAQQWHDEIGKALRRCDWFVLLLSESSIASRWVKMELQYALNHSQYTERILPVLLENCDYESLSWTLGAFHMVNLQDDFAVGCRGILATWGFGLDPDKLG